MLRLNETVHQTAREVTALKTLDIKQRRDDNAISAAHGSNQADFSLAQSKTPEPLAQGFWDRCLTMTY
ncbi:hypothetical protein, partial [Atopomonas sediminilitoris]|uniref:hypothetical protein n=1 Tax=Atopomonas sediminilitoris TaxID=2919919 RepID=UPI001F4EE802